MDKKILTSSLDHIPPTPALLYSISQRNYKIYYISYFSTVIKVKVWPLLTSFKGLFPSSSLLSSLLSACKARQSFSNLSFFCATFLSSKSFLPFCDIQMENKVWIYIGFSPITGEIEYTIFFTYTLITTFLTCTLYFCWNFFGEKVFLETSVTRGFTFCTWLLKTRLALSLINGESFKSSMFLMHGTRYINSVLSNQPHWVHMSDMTNKPR